MKKEGWLLRTTNENVEYLSVWPHPEYAKNIAKEYYPEYNEDEISLEDFMSNLLPKLDSDNVKSWGVSKPRRKHMAYGS